MVNTYLTSKSSSPSSQIYAKVFEKYRLEEDGLNKLIGKNISFECDGGNEVIAKVISVKEGKIDYEVIKHQFYDPSIHKDDNGEISPVHVSDLETSHCFVGSFEERICAFKVYTNMPVSIRAEHLVTEFTLLPADQSLDEVIKKNGLYDMQIISIRDVIELNDKLNKRIDTIDFVSDDYSDINTSLGNVLLNHEPACRHLAALEFGILSLNGVSSQIVATNKKTARGLRESHSFNHVMIDGDKYLVDPVNNWVFLLEESEDIIKRLGKPTMYHIGAEPLEFRFDY